jgi:hypothetical protein
MPKRCRAHGHTLPRTPPPSLELMDAARSYEHGRDAYLDHLGGKSRPGKPCASTRGFSCRCRRDGAQPAHSRISRGEHADRRRCPDPSPSCSRRTWHRQTLAEAWRSRASKLPPLSAVILNRGAVQNRATAPQAPVATWLPPWARSGPPFWAVNLPMRFPGARIERAVRECAITSNSHALC